MRKFVFLVLLHAALSANAQQRAMFTQYMFNGLAINPAYSSLDRALSITGIYRQQWTGFEGAPDTQTLTFHTPVNNSNTSVGAMLFRDHIGEVITETGAYLTAAQRVKLNDEIYFSAGLMAGISKYAADYSQLTDPVSASDPLFGNGNHNRLDIGFGMMLYSNKFYAGLSSPFFLSVNTGGSKLSDNEKPHFMFQGGYLVPVGEHFKFKPNVLVKYVKGSPVQADLNANLLIAETVWIGGSWRSFDSFDGLLQIQLTKNIQAGYSYDFITSQLGAAQKGSHEIMLSFRFPVKGAGFPRCYF